jgi:cell wall-associated NlpC family hydrolase
VIESTAPEPEAQPTPEVKQEIAQNQGIPFQGSAYILSNTPLRQTSVKSSSTVAQGKSGKIVELVTYMPEQKVYCVKMDGVLGYVPETALKTRVGAGPLGGVDPNNNLVAREALKYIGTPYVWGGNGLTTGIDCSHFVAQIYQRIGWRPVPPAPVTQQEQMGDIIHFKPGQARRGGQTITLPNPVIARRGSTNLRALSPGDRLIFQRGLTDASGSRHTAVYIGKVPKSWQARFGDIPYAFVHASSSRGVTVSSLTQKYYWNVYKFTVRSAHTNAAASIDDGVAAAFEVK